MKNTYRKPIATYVTAIVSAVLAVTDAHAQTANLNDPEITPILATISPPVKVPPNVFMQLDDSGSMQVPMLYSGNPQTTYEIPPDPASFNNATQEFDPLPLSPNTNMSGYDNAGFTNQALGDWDGYIPLCPTALTRTRTFTRWRRPPGGTSLAGTRPFYFQGGQIFLREYTFFRGLRYRHRAYNFTNHPDAFAPIGSTRRQKCEIFQDFYSSRMLALKSALAVSLQNQTVNYSLDFDFLHNDTLDNIQLFNMNRGTGDYRNSLSSFLNQLYVEDPAGGTPFRRATAGLFDNIRRASTIRTRDNIFLPQGATTYKEEELQYCKQNVSILLSDGEYNKRYAPNGDYDGNNRQYNWLDQDGNPAIFNFRGDGSINNQRVFAGGTNSLHPNPGQTDPFGNPVLSDRLSDIVFQAWAEDLNVSLQNAVEPYFPRPGFKDNSTPPPYLVNLMSDDTPTATVLAQVPEVLYPRNDPANWQRIVTYTVGLGIGTEWTDATIASVINNTDPTYTWPQNNASQDFARSGYVGRGGFYRADNPTELGEAFDSIFKDLSQRGKTSSIGAGVAGTSQVTQQTNNILFTTEMNNFKWTGDLKANWLYSGKWTSLNPSDRLPGDGDQCYAPQAKSEALSTAFIGKLCTSTSSKWSAVDNQKDWKLRKYYSINDSTKAGITFDYVNMSNNQQKVFTDMKTGVDRVASHITEQELVNFIKGNNKLASENTIRNRAEGKVTDNGAYGDFGRGGPFYLSEPDSNIWGQPPVDENGNPQASIWPISYKRHFVFAGANDGMLHAFNAETGDEIFSYLPNGVYKNFSALIKPRQQRVAFVDGTINAQEIIDVNGKPRTILVSGMGAGAKGLFALDVTDPDNFGQTNVLWEIDDKDDKRLGNIFGTPSIIRVEGKYRGSLEKPSDPAHQDRWVVAVGTGYGNITDGNTESGILILDILTGKTIDFLHLPTAKGVGEIAWVDSQEFKKPDEFTDVYYGPGSLWGVPDRGYVGDLAGNVWVIDFAYDPETTPNVTALRSAVVADRTNSAGYKNDLARLTNVKAPSPSAITADKPAPLFIATDGNGNRQPITSAIIVHGHPSNRGYMAYFGTGDLFQIDPLQNTGNSLYGIWDDIGTNYGIRKTADIEDYNVTRDRYYLTYYPWKQTETSFADSTAKAYARVIDYKSRDIAVLSPISWANTQGYTDSVATMPINYDTEVAFPSSGWVIDTGTNSDGLHERVFQAPFNIVNKKNEKGITFLMFTLEDQLDLCRPDANPRSWDMTFRTDIIDGPIAAFSGAASDSNNDGKIDEEDKIRNGGDVIVPLGAMPRGNPLVATVDGKVGMQYAPVAIEGIGNGPQGFDPNQDSGTECPNGTARSYKETDGQGGTIEKLICIPHTLSSWSEIE